MTWQPSAGSGPAFVSMHVISYCPVPQSDWQLSVPPDTPPSLAFTVAPLPTWQICAGGLAKHPGPDGEEFTCTAAG